MFENLNTIPTYKKVLIFNEIFRSLYPDKANDDLKMGRNRLFVYGIVRTLQKNYKFLKKEIYESISYKGWEEVLEFFINKFSICKEEERLSNIDNLLKEIHISLNEYSESNLSINELYNELKQNLLITFESNYYHLDNWEEEMGLFIASEIFRTILLLSNIKEQVKSAFQNHENQVDDKLFNILKHVSVSIWATCFNHKAGKKGMPRDLMAEKERRNIIINNIEKAYEKFYSKEEFELKLSKSLGISDRATRGYFDRASTVYNFKLTDLFVFEEKLKINRDLIFGEPPKILEDIIPLQRVLRPYELEEDKLIYARKVLIELIDFLKAFSFEQKYYDCYFEELINQIKRLNKEAKKKLKDDKNTTDNDNHFDELIRQAIKLHREDKIHDK